MKLRAWLCRYELQHVVRTHVGACDASYNCVIQQEDAAGKVRPPVMHKGLAGCERLTAAPMINPY